MKKPSTWVLWLSILVLTVAGAVSPAVVVAISRVFDIIGFGFQLYIILLVVVYVLHTTFATSVDPADINMPVLKPLQIPTKGAKWHDRTMTWLMARRGWTVHENWEFQATLDGNIETIVIPAGFEFDGASVPRPFWFLLEPMGLLLVPGLVHDYAYRYRRLVILKNGKQECFGVDKRRWHWDMMIVTIGRDANGFLLLNIIVCVLVYCFGYCAWRSSHTKSKKLPGRS